MRNNNAIIFFFFYRFNIIIVPPVPRPQPSRPSLSTISVVAMTGAAIAIEDASAADTILSVKERVFSVNSKLPVHRQRLVYRPGPFGMDALADDETLGGAGVARDGTAELDVLVSGLSDDEIADISSQVG